MTNVKMTVHEALREVKSLDKRIQAGVTLLKNSVVATMPINDKIGGQTKTEFIEATKANLQSVMDLIYRREAFKQAISESNAKTTIKLDCLDGKEISIAAAIDAQNRGLEYYSLVASTLGNAYAIAMNEATRMTARAEDEACRQKTIMLSGKTDTAVTKDIANLAETTYKTYYDTHKGEICDPLDAKKISTDLVNLVEVIEAEIDAKISVSNATTILEFSYKNYKE